MEGLERILFIKKLEMKTEKLSLKNITNTTRLILALWPFCSYQEEYNNCKRILSTKNERIQLAKIKDKYVGFIYLNLRTDWVEGTKTSPVAYIEGLYVKPKYRKKGIGKKLVEYGEQWGQKRGATEYGSDTELVNKASIAFHKKIGFKEANRIVCFAKKIE